jgi:hypothetical protein
MRSLAVVATFVERGAPERLSQLGWPGAMCESGGSGKVIAARGAASQCMETLWLNPLTACDQELRFERQLRRPAGSCACRRIAAGLFCDWCGLNRGSCSFKRVYNRTTTPGTGLVCVVIILMHICTSHKISSKKITLPLPPPNGRTVSIIFVACDQCSYYGRVRLRVTYI